jgi:outer membrane biosynthesis protein TonB
MIDVNTGDNINKAQVVDTDFNEMKIFYVLNKDYEDLPAGLIVPNGFVDKAIEMGVVEPKILVFGKQKGSSGKSVYFSIDNVALSQMMKTTPKDRPAIEELQNTLENKRKEIEAKLPPKGANPTPAPKPKPKPSPTPAPKSGEKPKKQPPKGTEDIFGELEKAAKPKNK